MPVPYSYDLRTKVIEAIDRGMKKTEASVIFNVSRNTINLWLKKRAETGDYKAKENYRRGYGHKIKDLWLSRKRWKKTKIISEST